MAELTHFDGQGRARMVDVSGKEATARVAVARGRVRASRATIDLIACGEAGKGDVLGVAQVAGIMAAKETSRLIPMCHPINLSSVDLRLDVDQESASVYIEAVARTTDRTGVEMEALTAVATAALTVYDMCKAVDRGMVIEDICLVQKSGGKSGDWLRQHE